MSFFPAIVALLVVMMLAASSARIAQDAGLSAAQRMDLQLARHRADRALRRAAIALVNSDSPASDVVIDELTISEQAELGDLPLLLYRLTVSGQGHQASVRVQADYVLDGCESEEDDPCTPRVRRIAWRELLP
jgi:Tfp pilus assembly protein PilX